VHGIGSELCPLAGFAATELINYLKVFIHFTGFPLRLPTDFHQTVNIPLNSYDFAFTIQEDTQIKSPMNRNSSTWKSFSWQKQKKTIVMNGLRMDNVHSVANLYTYGMEYSSDPLV